MLMYGERIATRKDWPELSKILDKALSAITEKKRLELYQVWISALASLEGPALLQQQNALTAEETAWVKEHREILLGVDPEFAPFEFIDETGQYTGIVPEYLHILKQRIGLNFKVAPGLSWKEAVKQARQGEIDMLPCVGKTSGRQKYLLFSKPYMYYQRVIITRTGTPFISSLDDIKGMTVAVQKETSHEGFIRENTKIQRKRSINPIFHQSTSRAIVGHLSTNTQRRRLATEWKKLTPPQISRNYKRRESPLVNFTRNIWLTGEVPASVKPSTADETV
jgi:hypothetical protein